MPLVGLILLVAGLFCSWLIEPASAQFIDRILRPCGGTSTGKVQVTTTNILINPCPGGVVTINGVPITPGAGFTCAGCTINTLMKTTGAGTAGDSRITDNGTNINADSGAGQFNAGDVTFANNRTVLSLDDVSRRIELQTGSLADLTVGSSGIFLTSASSPIQVDSASAVRLGDVDITLAGRVFLNDGAPGFVYFGQPNSAFNIAFDTNAKITHYGNAVPTDGQLLIGGTAAGNWTAGTIGATAPIVVTNGNNTINVSCPTCGTGTGTVTGTGTTNKLTLWTNGPGGVLGDSPVTASGANVTLAGELTAPLIVRSGTASNTDLAGSLTVGGGGTITRTFTQTYVTAPICVSSDTDAVPLITGASATTTVLTITGNAGHVVNYVCVGLN